MFPFKWTPAAGHYTQVMWARSYRIGCSMIVINDAKYRYKVRGCYASHKPSPKEIVLWIDLELNYALNIYNPRNLPFQGIDVDDTDSLLYWYL